MKIPLFHLEKTVLTGDTVEFRSRFCWWWRFLCSLWCYYRHRPSEMAGMCWHADVGMLRFKTLGEGRRRGKVVLFVCVRQVMLSRSYANGKVCCPASNPVCSQTLAKWGTHWRYFSLLHHFADGNILCIAVVSLGHFGKRESWSQNEKKCLSSKILLIH